MKVLVRVRKETFQIVEGTVRGIRLDIIHNAKSLGGGQVSLT